jgi:hypothetical protein
MKARSYLLEKHVPMAIFGRSASFGGMIFAAASMLSLTAVAGCGGRLLAKRHLPLGRQGRT